MAAQQQQPPQFWVCAKLTSTGLVCGLTKIGDGKTYGTQPPGAAVTGAVVDGGARFVCIDANCNYYWTDGRVVNNWPWIPDPMLAGVYDHLFVATDYYKPGFQFWLTGKLASGLSVCISRTPNNTPQYTLYPAGAAITGAIVDGGKRFVVKDINNNYFWTDGVTNGGGWIGDNSLAGRYDPAFVATDKYRGTTPVASAVPQQIVSPKAATAATATAAAPAVADGPIDTFHTIDNSTGVLSCVMGEAKVEGYAENGLLSKSRLHKPIGCTLSGDGNFVLIADSFNHKIRTYEPKSDRTSSFIGSGTAGIVPGTTTAQTARLNYTCSATVHPNFPSWYYICDNFSVRVFDGSKNKLWHLCGGTKAVKEELAFADATIGANVRFHVPIQLLFTADAKSAYCTDQYNHRIRLIDIATGGTHTVAGDGNATTRDGTWRNSSFQNPRYMAWDKSTAQPKTVMFISTQSELRRFNTVTGAVTTVNLDNPKIRCIGLASTENGVLIASCVFTHAIYAIHPFTGATIRLAGSLNGEGFINGSALHGGMLQRPGGLCVRAAEREIYTTEYYNCTLRKITVSQSLFTAKIADPVLVKKAAEAKKKAAAEVKAAPAKAPAPPAPVTPTAAATPPAKPIAERKPDVMSWTVDDSVEWLRALGKPFHRFTSLFRDYSINGHLILTATDPEWIQTTFTNSMEKAIFTKACDELKRKYALFSSAEGKQAPAATPAAAVAASPRAGDATPSSRVDTPATPVAAATPTAAAAATAAAAVSPRASDAATATPVAVAAAAAAAGGEGDRAAATPVATAAPPVPSATPPPAAADATAASSPTAAGTATAAGATNPVPPSSAILTAEALSKAEVSFVAIPKSEEEWDDAVKEFKSSLGHNDDYVATRIKAGKKPISFRITEIERVVNPVLTAQFEAERKRLGGEAKRSADELRLKIGFHGTRESNIKKIARTGLLRVGHPLNPSKSTDPGWFGSPMHGVYLSRHADYALKYSNDLAPLDPGDSVKIILFKLVSGRSFHVAQKNSGMMPTAEHDSHSSANFLEWYLFHESMCVPHYVLTVKAFEDRRTDADDKSAK